MADTFIARFKCVPPSDDCATPSTISVLRMSEVPTLAQRSSDLAHALRSHLVAILPAMVQVRFSADLQHYEISGDDEITFADAQVDLYDLASLIQGQMTQEDIRTAAANVMSAVDETVLFHDEWSGTYIDKESKEKHLWDHDDSQGVAIWFPRPWQLDTYYTADWLDFASGTNWEGTGSAIAAITSEPQLEWGQFLADFTLAVTPDAPIDPNPPEMLPLGYGPSANVYLPIIVKNE